MINIIYFRPPFGEWSIKYNHMLNDVVGIGDNKIP